jgi:hypothetical protein
VAGRDITEGRASRSIAVDIGLNTGTVWQNTTVDYDMAIGGIPFLYAINDQRPYERSTALVQVQEVAEEDRELVYITMLLLVLAVMVLLAVVEAV